MKRTKAILWGVLIVSVGLGLFWFLTQNSKTDWSVRFQWQDDLPHNFLFFHNILAANRQSAQVTTITKNLEETLGESKGNKNVYLQLGYSKDFKYSEARSLVDFMHAGNTAFIATPTTPAVLLQHIYLSPDSLANLESLLFFNADYILPDSLYYLDQTPYEEDSTLNWFIRETRDKLREDFGSTVTKRAKEVTLTLSNGTALLLYLKQWNGIEEQYWNYFYSPGKSRIMEKATVLGTMDDQLPFFIEIPVGQGKLQLMMEPLLFTNYHIQRPEGFAFIRSIVNDWGIEKSSDIYIDRINRFNYQQQSPSFSGSPLSFILAQESLRWGWYLGLLALLVFVMSNLRRKQREIPVLPKITNTTLEFSKALGTLDQMSITPAEEAEEIMRLFKSEVVEKLRIPFDDTPKKYIDILANYRPEIQKTLEKAFALHHTAKTNPKAFDKPKLIALYNAIQQIEKAL
ncbi:MAG: hypothetical protein LAT76_08650 [Schleiferiaceae bacterium]|nr:hypothetical protein [Schleiferiaceae bacterium]